MSFKCEPLLVDSAKSTVMRDAISGGVSIAPSKDTADHPHATLAYTKNSKKYLWFRHPTQLFTHGQWWSMSSTQASQELQ
mmetsp:Transcript_92433/g.257181  ORF Transcript_92433/g.257181 Transcript_92433/m.257181 type:complete len:80 (-) Transcript_92433:36-275(-)